VVVPWQNLVFVCNGDSCGHRVNLNQVERAALKLAARTWIALVDGQDVESQCERRRERDLRMGGSI
jgi:hypothetical protein